MISEEPTGSIDPRVLMMFPPNVFLDLLDIQFPNWKESEQVKSLLESEGITYMSFQPLRDIEKADKRDNNPTLCAEMIQQFGTYKLDKEVKYSLVRQILKTIVSEKGVDFVGANLTDPLDNETPLSNSNPAAIRRKADLIERYMDNRIKDIITSQRPWLLVTAGVPGVGKSHVMQHAHDYLGFDGLRDKKYFNCDPDQIYGTLRDCEEEDKPLPSRHFVNYWNHVSFGIALSRRSNIVFDGSGKECLNICGRAIARAQDEGYEIGFLFVTLPMETIIRQIYDRDQLESCGKKGRQTPLGFVKTTAEALVKRVPDYIEWCGPKNSAVVLNDRSRLKEVDPKVANTHLNEFVKADLNAIQAMYDAHHRV